MIILVTSTSLIVGPASTILFLLILLETAVALIQGYVFSILVLLYMSETYECTAKSPTTSRVPQPMTHPC